MKRFDDLCSALAKEIKVRSAVLYGEIVVLDEKTGKPAFYQLMKRNRQAVYFAFDLLWRNGEDLRELPLLERKKFCARSFLQNHHGLAM
jgi:ATP-dependent DNA ligase